MGASQGQSLLVLVPHLHAKVSLFISILNIALSWPCRYVLPETSLLREPPPSHAPHEHALDDISVQLTQSDVSAAATAAAAAKTNAAVAVDIAATAAAAVPTTVKAAATAPARGRFPPSGPRGSGAS